MTAATKVVKPFFILILAIAHIHIFAQGTRLLRQPDISGSQIAFAYGGDIWVTQKNGGDARRITSTAAVEGNLIFLLMDSGSHLTLTAPAFPRFTLYRH